MALSLGSHLWHSERKLCLLVGASLILTSCAVGPDYRRPSDAELGAPTEWQATIPHGGAVTGLTEWWENFDDPALTHFVTAAEEGSPTIAMAIARVREARASVTATRSSLLPSVNGSGSVSRSKNAVGLSRNSSTDAEATVTSASIDAGWEIDIFGGNRRDLEAARARFGSAEANWHDARVTLAAEVANVYSTARHYQNLVALYEEVLASRKATERLTSLRIREGLAPSADSFAVEAASALAASVLESQRGLFTQTCNQLVLLTGLGYSDVKAILGEGADIPKIQGGISLGLPAQVVAQRPDVRSAEQQLAAVSAEIGVAYAKALPSLTLFGSIGVNATRINDANTTIHTWSFGPSLNLPIFQAGANSARIEAARARYDQALAAYRSNVLIAVRDIENALARINTVSLRLGDARRAAESYSAYLDAIEQSYREGRSSLLQLEDARRQSLSARESLFSVHLEHAQSWIALYKAVGGGWPISNSFPVVASGR